MANTFPTDVTVAVLRLLRSSWTDIDFQWGGLTAEERQAIGDEEIFDYLCTAIVALTQDEDSGSGVCNVCNGDDTCHCPKE